MKEFSIQSNEAGQRFEKYLAKVLPKASMGFIFKMLRKKNFILNDKKADGKEILKQGDCVKLFLSEETFHKFSSDNSKRSDFSGYPQLKKDELSKVSLAVIYENRDILIFYKPVGMLSQKSKPSDLSVNEYLIGYMLAEGMITSEELKTFKPSIANRLDRNTSGIILCGKSLAGLQFLSELLKERTLHKYYRTIVYGNLKKQISLEGFLTKDETRNKVTVTKEKQTDGDEYIRTIIDPIGHYRYRGQEYTEVKVLLVTGKPHQIRAHLSSIGHPLIGDYKYGNFHKRENPFPIRHQLLHAYKVSFPNRDAIKKEAFSDLAGQTFYADLSPEYQTILEILKNGNME